MLIDSRKQEKDTNEEGFNPNVQNKIIPAKSSVGGKIGFITLSILTLSIYFFIVWVGKRNWFNRMQIQVNQASSNIDVQLKQRRDTLVKLVDVTKSSVKFEKNLLTDVTKLRSIKNFNPIAPSNTTNLNKLESLNTKIMATLENYPKLESVKTIRELMNSADYLEREIAATRRTYNATVTSFNQALYVWPTNIVASSLHLYNLPLFATNDAEKSDVNLVI